MIETMKVRCEVLFPGEIIDAILVEAPSQAARNATETRLELAGPAPVQLSPPDAFGTTVVEATPAEWDALREAGYELSPSK